MPGIFSRVTSAGIVMDSSLAGSSKDVSSFFTNKIFYLISSEE
jgi:hypothetical protein